MQNKSDTQIKEPCRKCGSLNPNSNEYCSSCGAVLKISTNLMRAQPKIVVPIISRFKIKWVIMGIFIMLGTGTIAISLTLLIGISLFKRHGADNLSELFFTISFLMGLSFMTGGAIMSLMSKSSKIAESIFASILAALLFGFAGSSVSSDILKASLILIVPGALIAGLGAFLGIKIKGI